MNGLLDGLSWLFDGENWSGPAGVGTRLVEHVWISGVAVLIACAIALPIGLWLGHLGRGGTLAINISNIGRAVPTFAILALIYLTPLGLSVWTTIISLVLFGIPPILTNAYVGMREVDRDAVEAARGMGMSGGQLLRGVELPLAIPLVMGGIRLATVQIVATATLAAVISGPGLGRIITSGFGRQDTPQVIGGAIIVGLLALVIEGLMAWLQRAVDPMRRARRRRARPDRDPGMPLIGDEVVSGA
ncbi:ABC transporter permease [Jiangella alkaliphila]|uniref:Osmoprotectant transport system permease protein n=1 Tax=Jiangella alkaliphila TaxID=419479 RepID=A0A1H2IAX4_9ACTN|nr:ABC transporter permease [Jiangella alkaliphila]SDU41310.1 osmoprotectant transport system permease protein [Jiangella alkaliphila]